MSVDKKLVAKGWIGIGIIIVIIVGAVMVLLPEESETAQNADVAKPNSKVEFDPIIVEDSEKVIPFFQDSFRLILEQCHAVDSYTDYLAFEESIPWTQTGNFIGIEKANKALTNLEILGYDNHPTVGPMIKITKKLAVAVDDCIIDLQDKYEKNLEIIKKQKEEARLDTEELQTIISGFESYNKSVKILLDMCGNVESENDFRLLGQLIVEYGNDFIKNTSDYGAIRDKLMAEGYGEHSVLGPLMDQTVFLVDLMTTCMDVLAWEFSG